ncbi:MAG: hypothetical protein AB7D16_10620 [Eubacteriaceae bacterium]
MKEISPSVIENFKNEFLQKIAEVSGECLEESSSLEQYTALSEMVMEKTAAYWASTSSQYASNPHKRVYLFSIEFLIGRLLKSYLASLDLEPVVKTVFSDLGLDYAKFLIRKPTPAWETAG